MKSFSRGSLLRRCLPTKLLFLVVLSYSFPSAFATTYYVHPYGNDINNGLSISTPWATLAKVNSRTFAPGDQILFARGGEWRESLVASSDGTSANPITYGAYGDGANPKFWGSDVLQNSKFIPLGGNAYVYPLAKEVTWVLVDHKFTFISHPPAWSWSNSLLYITTLGSDPRTDGHVYTAVVREDAVYNNGHSHLVFRELVTDETAKLEGGYGFRVQGGEDVLLQHCEAYRAGKHHFGIINTTGFVARTLYAAYVAPDQSGASAFVSYGDTAGVAGQTSEWHDCEFDHTHPDEPFEYGGVYYSFVSHGPNLGSIWIDNMTSRDARLSVNNVESGAAVRLTRGLIENSRLSLSGSGYLVDGMFLTGAYASIDLDASNSIVQNTVIEGAEPYPLADSTGFRQVAVLSRRNNNILRFSTIVMGPDACPDCSPIGIGANYYPTPAPITAAFSYYGNILATTGSAIRYFELLSPTGIIADSRYNFYLPGTTFLDSHLSLSQWKQQGYDIGSASGDPVFVNTSWGDYTLRSWSPAIDTAFLSPSLFQAVPLDAAGRPRLQGITFDMGAFERTPSPAGSSAGASSALRRNSSAALTVTGVEPTKDDATVVATSEAVVSQPFRGVVPTVPGYIRAVEFDIGGEGVATHVRQAHNSGVFRNTDLNITYSNSNGSLAVFTRDAGDWMNYTVNVTATGNYDLTVITCGLNENGVLLAVDGVSVSNLLYAPSTAWGVYQFLTQPQVRLTQGTHVLRVYTGGPWMYIDSILFAPSRN